MLRAHDLHKRYGDEAILQGIDLTVQPGTITAIIGPSGGGKSTLLRILALLEPADSGAVEVDGEAWRYPLGRTQPLRPPWPRLGVVFQQLFLWPHLTLRENVLLPARLQGLPDAPAEAERLVELFGLAGALDRHPNETSVGQRQRAALVRALVLQPTYLLLDEITSALDVEHVVRVHQELVRQRDRGVGIVVVTHLVGFARSAASKIVFMERGQVVETGAASILSEPTTDRLRQFLTLVDTAA